MNDIDLDEAVELLNDYLEEMSGNTDVSFPYSHSEGSCHIERDGRCSLGSGAARALLEGMGAIVVKTLYVEDEDVTRIWLQGITSEEVEVTRIEERFTFDQ